ncbi:hypothetical protein NUW54_g11333 [Trametes sanguinea]|uniref:Uncharacterized protein n=1 Tax=Trametes sanguinea TaxID=158606 RepID=A0ACC1NFL2_9APHY|nr:hypothetical protein NUW54_g11333 [Trametes sanguinea]
MRKRLCDVIDGPERNSARPQQAGRDSVRWPRRVANLSTRTLRLRGAPRNRQRVVWREDVVDNEGAGKKKSKICCIYHKPRRFDESSSSDDSSDSDSSCDGRRPRRCRDHDHDHDHGEHADGAGGGMATRDAQGSSVVHQVDSDSDDVNAYERMPRRKPKKNKHVPHNPPTNCTSCNSDDLPGSDLPASCQQLSLCSFCYKSTALGLSFRVYGIALEINRLSTGSRLCLFLSQPDLDRLQFESGPELSTVHSSSDCLW